MLKRGPPDVAPEPNAGSKKSKGMPTLLDDDASDASDADIPEGKDKVCEEDFVTMVVVEGDKKSREKAPPSFFARPAYVQLSEQGFTTLPDLPGVGLWYHNSTTQWHGHYDGKNFAPTWGAKRSEREAILLTIAQLWEWFLEVHPTDGEALARVELLKLELQDNCA